MGRPEKGRRGHGADCPVFMRSTMCSVFLFAFGLFFYAISNVQITFKAADAFSPAGPHVNIKWSSSAASFTGRSLFHFFLSQSSTFFISAVLLEVITIRLRSASSAFPVCSVKIKTTEKPAEAISLLKPATNPTNDRPV